MFCGHSRAKSSFSAGIHNTIEETMPYVAKMTCFTVKIVAAAGPPPETTTLSRIRPPGALGPAIWATRPPAARQNTVLSERPWLLSRARGGVRLGNAQQHRGLDVTDGARDGNLGHIRRCRFSNSQHSRGFDAPARGRGGDLRHIRSRILDTIEETTRSVGKMTCFTV